MRLLAVIGIFSVMGLHLSVNLQAQGVSPVGNWEVSLSAPRNEHGIGYLNFSTNMTWTGYGISLESFGQFNIAGTWSVDAKGNVVGGYTWYAPGGDHGGTLDVKLPGGTHLRGKANNTGGELNIRGERPTTVPNVTGLWNATVQTDHKQYVTYTLTASTNTFGWFDLSGSGNGPNGPFDISGAILAGSDNKANGYVLTECGPSCVVTSSFTGKFTSSLKKAKFRGRDTDGHRVVIRAEK